MAAVTEGMLASLVLAAWGMATVAPAPTVSGYVQRLWGHPELVAVDGGLPNKHVIPILFYWDMFFMNRGLLAEGRRTLARNIVDNLLVEVDRLGFVPNASARWGHDRSQPPYLAMMVRDVYEAERDRGWLAQAIERVEREYAFWTDAGPRPLETHASGVAGLQRYAHHATDDALVSLYDDSVAPRLGLRKDVSRGEKLRVAGHRMIDAVSGWDFSPRFDGRGLDFVPVDLNVNLYLYERTFAWAARELGRDESVARRWDDAAATRQRAIEATLWDPARGMYVDYDARHARPGPVACLVTFWPLWAGLASPERAAAVAHNLTRFEEPFGAGACEAGPRPGVARKYQWDHQTAWPHLQPVVVAALDRYGHKDDARRIARKFVTAIERNFAAPALSGTGPVGGFVGGGTGKLAPGKTWEKYSALDGKLPVDEYGVNECRQVAPAAYVVLSRYLAGGPGL